MILNIYLEKGPENWVMLSCRYSYPRWHGYMIGTFIERSIKNICHFLYGEIHNASFPLEKVEEEGKLMWNGEKEIGTIPLLLDQNYSFIQQKKEKKMCFIKILKALMTRSLAPSGLP